MNAFAKYEDYDVGDPQWVPFAYTSYWDFPRVFAVNLGDYCYVLESDFLEEKDDYDDHFVVRRIRSKGSVDPKLVLAGPLSDLESVGRIPVHSVTFDRKTHRSFIRIDSLRSALIALGAA